MCRCSYLNPAESSSHDQQPFKTWSYFEIFFFLMVMNSWWLTISRQLPVWSWNRWVGRRGPAQSGLLDMNTMTWSASRCGGIPWVKTNAPTATVEQLQLVMNPIVGLFSRRLLNTANTANWGCISFQDCRGAGRSCQACLLCVSAPPCFISPSLSPQNPHRWCARSLPAVPAGRTAPAQSGRSWTSSGWTAAASQSEREPNPPRWQIDRQTDTKTISLELKSNWVVTVKWIVSLICSLVIELNPFIS